MQGTCSVSGAGRPAEAENLAAHQPQRVRQLHQQLKAWLRAGRADGPAAPNAEDQERLRSLGYLEN